MSAPRRPRAIWREVLVRSWRMDRPLTVVVILLLAGQVVALATVGLALRSVVNSALHGGGASLLVSSLLVAIGVGLNWIGGYVLLMLRSDLADRIGYLQIDPEVQGLTADLDGLEHLERTDYLDRLGLIVGKGQVLADAGWGMIEAAALFGQIAITLVLLATVHPALLALGLFAVPATLLGRVGARQLRAATVRAASDARLERHLHEVTTAAAAGKEIRVCNAGEALIGRAADAWSVSTIVQLRGRLRAAWLSAIGSTVFVIGYAATLVFVAALVSDHRRSVGDLILVITLAGQLRIGFGQLVRKFTQAQAGLALAEPYRWLQAHAAAQQRPADQLQRPPAQLRHGIRLAGLSFTYAGADRPALGPVDAELPAGAMVALVGEHGSGKTTLVKLLCQFYQPTAGSIDIDGIALVDIEPPAWRAVTTAAFQDFDRFQVRLRHAVGFGEIAIADQDERVLTAIHKGDAQGVHDRLPDGLESQLGTMFGGYELSEGQWQKVALARTCMRQDPLLVVLDEPTASLDPPSEHAIFQRHAAFAREMGERLGTVTVVVSHRFSTVRMADLILVLDHGQVVERGDHDHLMAIDGTYAQLYRMQETAYQHGPPRQREASVNG